jgi:hypothetical protein
VQRADDRSLAVWKADLDDSAALAVFWFGRPNPLTSTSA